MRTWYLFKKFIIETIRDWKLLIFVLIFGPLFVAIFFGVFNNHETTYKVAVYNKDVQVSDSSGTTVNVGESLLDLLGKQKNSDGTPMFKIIDEKDLDKAKKNIRAKKYDGYIVFPENFSQRIVDQISNPNSTKADMFVYGDKANENYMISAIMINEYCIQLINSITGKSSSFNFVEEFVVDYKNRTTFEASIPAAIMVGIIMILFTAAIALIKEVDSGTLRRLQISKASGLEVLTSLNLTQIIIGFVEVAITLFTAFVIFNAKPGGDVATIFLISMLACISVIPIGFIVASFSRTTSDILIFGNIPYMLLFIFSGAFPIPRLNLFTISGYTIAINDFLPTTPAMTALKKVMDEGAGLESVLFDLAVVIIVTAVYYVIGIRLFNKKHMKLV